MQAECRRRLCLPVGDGRRLFLARSGSDWLLADATTLVVHSKSPAFTMACRHRAARFPERQAWRGVWGRLVCRLVWLLHTDRSTLPHLILDHTQYLHCTIEQVAQPCMPVHGRVGPSICWVVCRSPALGSQQSTLGFWHLVPSGQPRSLVALGFSRNALPDSWFGTEA